jgi:transposase
LLGQEIRDVEFNDDRLGGVLRRLSDDAAWAGIERDLWAATVTVYELELSGVRLDSTTSAGYHKPQVGGVMQHGHSKDQRPDLAQVKLMAAAAEPSGHLLASDVAAGNRADDPLYVPLIERVRDLVGRTGLVYAGDSKMAAFETRSHIATHGDYYVVPLPRTGSTAEQFETWVEAAVTGEQFATLVWEKERMVAAGYEFSRPQTATQEGESVSWQERVLVVRSPGLAQRQVASLEKRLQTAQAKLESLTPDPGPGRRQMRDEAALQAGVEQILKQQRVVGLLAVQWEREESSATRYKGPGRPGPKRKTYTETSVRYRITSVQRQEAAITAHKRRLGWRVYATNVPQANWPFPQVVRHYRQGWLVERDFRLVKNRPLGLSPLFVWKEEQITGLVRLLTLALRLLTLIESQVRRGLAADHAELAGLYPGQPSRTTDRPTGRRLFKAFARANLTLSRVQLDAAVYWHMMPLSPLHQQILAYLCLPLSLYTDLAHY